MTKWRTMIEAPQDGTEIVVHLPAMNVKAFWCRDLERWVLSRPLNRDYADDATAWHEAANAGEGDPKERPGHD